MNRTSFGNSNTKIDGYRALWSRSNSRRPLIGISRKDWFPMREFTACREWERLDYLSPDLIDPQAFLEDQKALLAEGHAVGDDILRGACPFQGVGWLCGMLGLPIHILTDSTMQDYARMDWNEILALELDPCSPWYRKYFAFMEVLVADAAGVYPVSHGNLSGPSDLLVSFRGGQKAIMDLVDDPGMAREAVAHFGRLFAEITRRAWDALPRWEGGCFDAQYQLWAPGPIVRIQEDATSLFSPDLYRNIVLETDRFLASAFEFAFLHTHSSQILLLNEFLSIGELNGLQMNYEPDAGGPALRELLPRLRCILESGKVLILRGRFARHELEALENNLPPEGLYLYCMAENNGDEAAVKAVFDLESPPT